MSEPAPLGVYVHWPYCARICPYCDFNVVRDRAQAEQPALVDAIVADLHAYAALTGARRLVSVFFGGGTPSLMRAADVARVLDAAVCLWSPAASVEVSLEANPTDAEAGRFAALAAAGVNRLSLGVQALDDAALAALGRNHTAAEGVRAVETALAAVDRVSVDLIYARQNQSVEAWTAELSRAVALGPEHVSPYQLTIEPGTAFDRAMRRGTLTPPGEALAADLYETTQAVLGAAGYEAYEVSNHALGATARSRHNLVYWRGEDYVGVGPGAHGRLTLDGVRHATLAPRRVADAIAAAGRPTLEPLTADERLQERVLLGLRVDEGVGVGEVSARVLSRARMFEGDGLITVDDRVRVTPAGRRVLDRLTAELLG